MDKIKNYFPLPETNCRVAVEIIQKSFKIEVEKTGIQKIVLGLSGGIDSALVLYLAVAALGENNIKAFYLPYKLSSPVSRKHAIMAANACNVSLIEKDISGAAEPLFNDMSVNEFSGNEQNPESNISENLIKLRKGNILARLRMITLYDQSVLIPGLVAGTSNKTEILLGYSTLWGDMASAVNPIGDLYKFQVRDISRYLKIPQEIIDKPPSADLWEGQTDEGELNLSYDLIDRILYHWIDLGWNRARIESAAEKSGIDPEKINSVFQKVMKSQFKRKMPLIIKVSEKTIDREFRYPRDWGL